MTRPTTMLPPPSPEGEASPAKLQAEDADTRSWQEILQTAVDTWRPQRTTEPAE